MAAPKLQLSVTAVKAANLPNVDSIGKSDPYCQIEFRNETKKTPKIDNDLDPHWNFNMLFDMKGPLTASEKLKATVYDYELVGAPKFLGEVDVSLMPLLSRRKIDLNLPLLDSQGKTNGDGGKRRKGHKRRGTRRKRKKPRGTLTLTIEYTGTQKGSAPKPPADSADGVTAVAAAVGDGGGGRVGDHDSGASDVVDGIDHDGFREARHVDASGWAAAKPRAPRSTKPQDWQIRIKIIEARQLVGANISPVCRITCQKEIRITRVKKNTNSPFWDQSFSFNFHMSAADLFDELIVLAIYNSRKLRQDSLLCSFKCDLGLIYDSDDHTLSNKWVMMTDPEDLNAGPKGYLKVCMCVLGPGDDAPSFKATEQGDDEDIEANILRPSGMQIRAAFFRLRIYRCEDLPRMDPDFIPGLLKKVVQAQEKDMADPFVIFSFAGKEVVTKTKYHTYNPVFNEELHLCFQFPSMCERLRVQVMDWDRLSENDPIGACMISIAEISAKGKYGDDADGHPEGFLPTFGPTYITMYGSPREFAAINDYEHLNIGKGEGAAYRGRVLVELKTSLEEKSENFEDSVDVPREDILRIEKFQRKRKFRLYAALISANMVSKSDDVVEFEVSIGNYGNILDESAAVCASTSTPCCPVSDGNFYYYVPWTNNKPCCVVESHWEDTVYRLEALNVLQRIIVRLSDNLARVDLALKSKLPSNQTATLISQTVDQLVRDCKTARLPELTNLQIYPTELDRNLRALREAELRRIAKSAQALIDSRDEANVQTKLENSASMLDSLLQSLKALAVEPQNAIPDVIIWMLCGGDKRVAYARIPANEVLFSSTPERCGLQCGKTMTVYLKKMVRQGDRQTLGRRIPAQLRLKLWFGQHSLRKAWLDMHPAGTVETYAEVYEYEGISIGKMFDSAKSRWSDAKGKIELNRDAFCLPPGWKFDGDWFLDPDVTLTDDSEAGHSQYVQEIYENEYRSPGSEWKKPVNDYSDIDNNKVDKNMECPSGWAWSDEWAVDYNRPCDEEGWEYSLDGSKDSFVSVMRVYHLCRRRRMIRTRVRTAAASRPDSTVIPIQSDGWEYGSATGKFHNTKKASDTQRRRRYHRRVVHSTTQTDTSSAEKPPEKTDKSSAVVCPPRTYIAYKEPHRYQLRAYIFQARDLRAGDEGGSSDPYAHISFKHSSQTTEVVSKTICPKWDQTMVFNNILLYGDPFEMSECLPDVVVEIFDHDLIGEHDFLGRAVAKPLYRMHAERDVPIILEWWPVMRGRSQAGELLASFELFLMNEGETPPPLPPMKLRNYIVPDGIRPAMQFTRIEILCWGVRNMEQYLFSDVESPFVEFEIDGARCVSTTIQKAKRNPNFARPAMHLDVRLPVEQLYMPPMNVTVRDTREFGRKPIVGRAVIKHLDEWQHEQFMRVDENHPDPIGRFLLESVGTVESGEFGLDFGTDDEKIHAKDKTVSDSGMEDPPAKRGLLKSLYDKKKKKKKAKAKPVGLISLEESVDWWSKFYASVGERSKCQTFLESGYDNDTMFICQSELEKSEDYKEFGDFCHTLELYRGKNLDNDCDSVGELKISFFTCKLEEDPSLPAPELYFDNVPSNDPVECLLRVFILRAIDLQPNDASGLADPYLEITLGKSELNNRSEYIPNTLTPIFGKMFELKCVIPIDKDLYIRVRDYDVIGSDDTVGETKIDLENRLMTKYRATCGLPRNYYLSGPYRWRDSQLPKDLLEAYCQRNRLPAPVFYSSEENTKVRIGKRVFRLREFEKKPPAAALNMGPPDQRLALHILNKLPLVKEHVETRPLYSTCQAGIEQGKLQMWLDIYPLSFGQPGPPPNITPRTAKTFELRIIIWNTYDVILSDENVLGEQTSDIYVKGWLSGLEEDEQATDVHYRSLTGEGNFNWRFVFRFDYLVAEQVIKTSKKEHFWSLDETIDFERPVLNIQVWDNDVFSPDDFLGTIELELTHMIKPAKTAEECGLHQLPDVTAGAQATPIETINLFDCRRQRGIWPCYSDESGPRTLTGKVEMELEILTEADADERKAARAREEPNQNPHLEPPKRPETSFLWITSPWKSFRQIIWKKFKWYLIGGLIIALLTLFILLFFYNIPGAAVSRLFGV